MSKCMASESLLADIILQKFFYHMPFYRVIQKYKELDVNPREWMEDVLLRIPGNGNNREALRELLPDKWAKQTN